VTAPQDLAALNGRQLVRFLSRPAPGLAGLSRGEWLAVAELLALRLSDDREPFSADDWGAASAAVVSGDSMGASNRENYERFGEGVGIALREAGWLPGRSVDVTKWVQQLESVGYPVSPYARQVWAEFGNLNIRSLSSRVPKSSLRVDPVDAGIDTVDEAQRLAVRLQATFAPLGMWSSQFRAYVGDQGRVVAVGPRSAWFLGDTIESALRFIVEGEGRGITRPDIEEWILLINTCKAIWAMVIPRCQ
jgi:hypothetical protein